MLEEKSYLTSEQFLYPEAIFAPIIPGRLSLLLKND